MINNQDYAKKLEKAAQIIEDGWCRGTYAVDADGISVSENDPAANRFCALGALFKVGISSCIPIEDQLRKEGQPYSIANYNDFVAKDKRYVVRLFRRVAKRLLSQ